MIAGRELAAVMLAGLLLLVPGVAEAVSMHGHRLPPLPAHKPEVVSPVHCARAASYRELQGEYRSLFHTVVPAAERRAEIEAMAARIEANRPRYEAVSRKTRVPWYFIGLVHGMESRFDFGGHLHNGDTLPGRTVNTPRGRPVRGQPPYSWEESAVDALSYKAFDRRRDWNLTRVLWRLEVYNGFGYRKRGLCTPYLWSFSNHFRTGLYLDGKFRPEAPPRQVGAGLVLKALVERGSVRF
jgi:lysozyme family protein